MDVFNPVLFVVSIKAFHQQLFLDTEFDHAVKLYYNHENSHCNPAYYITCIYACIYTDISKV